MRVRGSPLSCVIARPLKNDRSEPWAKTLVWGRVLGSVQGEDNPIEEVPVARFMAIHSVPDITEEKFREALAEARNWRPDRRDHYCKGLLQSGRGKTGLGMRGGGAGPLRGLDKSGGLVL